MGGNASSATTGSGLLIPRNVATFIDLHIPPHIKFLIWNIKSIVQTPLATESHQIWRLQVFKLFKANDYADHLTGESLCLIKHITTYEGIIIEIPYYS